MAELTTSEMAKYLINRAVTEEIKAKTDFTEAFSKAGANRIAAETYYKHMMEECTGGFCSSQNPYKDNQTYLDKQKESLQITMEDTTRIRKFIVEHFTQYVK